MEFYILLRYTHFRPLCSSYWTCTLYQDERIR